MQLANGPPAHLAGQLSADRAAPRPPESIVTSTADDRVAATATTPPIEGPRSPRTVFGDEGIFPPGEGAKRWGADGVSIGNDIRMREF